ncbi:MAG: VOC family protein [Phascolarctobacterium faecium]
MEKELKIKMYSFTLDCINPYALAKFYAELLNWEIPFYDENWACIGAPGMSQGAYPGILFQRNQSTVRLCGRKNRVQQQMAHLDFAVNDLEEAVQHAINCGATMAAEQFSEEWRVMFDPAGHPFVLPYESNF